jgi:hypothetical protein
MGACFSQQKYMNLYIGINSDLIMKLEKFSDRPGSIETLFLSIPCVSLRDGYTKLHQILVSDLGIIGLVPPCKTGNITCYLAIYTQKDIRRRTKLCFESNENISKHIMNGALYSAKGITFEGARNNLKNRIIRDLKI